MIVSYFFQDYRMLIEQQANELYKGTEMHQRFWQDAESIVNVPADEAWLEVLSKKQRVSTQPNLLRESNCNRAQDRTDLIANTRSTDLAKEHVKGSENAQIKW